MNTERKSLEPYIKDEVHFYPHQVSGARHLWRMRSFLLADDMGLGKSVQALTVFGMDVIKGWSHTAIIICPATLKANWVDEIEKFTRFPYVMLQGNQIERVQQLAEFTAMDGPKILIVNYEQVKAHLSALNALSFDVAIFDEAHFIKNYRSQRTKASLALYSRRSFLLTGTPMLNQVNELWPLLHRIDPKAFPRYWSFVNRFCIFGGWKDKQIVGVKNRTELTNQLDYYMLRRLKTDVLDLPEVQIIERRVDLLPEQQKIYDEILSELQVTMTDDPDPQDIENALTKFLRLKQVCGTTKPFTDEDISSKLDLAIEDAHEMLENGHRIVVFTQFRSVLACYVERLGEAVPVYQLHGGVPPNLRHSVVSEWAKTETAGALVCMLQVGGQGLNMTAARHIQFIDKLFVPGLNQQAIDRCHRIGADVTQPVQVFEYIARNTIENRVNQILRSKSKLAKQIVEAQGSEWKRNLVAAVLSREEEAPDAA